MEILKEQKKDHKWSLTKCEDLVTSPLCLHETCRDLDGVGGFEQKASVSGGSSLSSSCSCCCVLGGLISCALFRCPGHI